MIQIESTKHGWNHDLFVQPLQIVETEINHWKELIELGCKLTTFCQIAVTLTDIVTADCFIVNNEELLRYISNISYFPCQSNAGFQSMGICK